MFNQWNDRTFFIAGYLEDDLVLLHAQDESSLHIHFNLMIFLSTPKQPFQDPKT